MKFKDYVLNAQKVYKFRLRTVVEVDDEVMDKIERVLQKYVPNAISRPKKTIMQKSPLDFVGIQYAEVYIIDFETSLPASPWMLRRELEVGMGVPEKYIVIRSMDDPIEIESEKLDGEDVPASEDIGPLVGNEYNSAFLQYVTDAEKNRKETVAKIAKKKIDLSLLNTLDMSKPPSDKKD